MEEDKIIYLDNASTTKVDEKVLETYITVSKEYFANPSSIHIEGNKANRLLEKAKEQILSSFHVSSTHEVILLSGATEGNNLALKGFAHRYKNRGNHIITSKYEHPSVLEALEQLKLEGFVITYLDILPNGKIDIEQLKKEINDKTIIVSIMAVNNEIGAINDINEIAKIVKTYPKAIFHVDATQAIGKINLSYIDVDMFTFSGHKIHAPHYIGALVKRKNIELMPLLSGGGQEYNYRSGTNDVALSACLAKAIRLSIEKQKDNYNKVYNLAKLIYDYLEANKDEYHINSNIDNPYIINFSSLKKKASVIVQGLSMHNIMVSSTSACHSSKEKGSYVVKALTNDELLANNTVRISLDKNNTKEEIEIFIKTLDQLIRGIKQ